MNNSILAFLALLFYGITILWQSIYFIRKIPVTAKGPLLPGFIAIFIHTVLLYYWIDVGDGQNLSAFNLLSLVTWLIAVLILFSVFRKPVANLMLLVFPAAFFSIVLALLFPQVALVNTASNHAQLIHILLSTLAFSILSIAGLQSLLLAGQERLLHQKQTVSHLQIFPPLEVMESLLFEILLLGFILLTLVIITSFFAFYPHLTAIFWEKSLLAVFAWLVFLMLLIGKFFFGWRGQQVVRWTISGVFVVMLTYFGSKFF